MAILDEAALIERTQQFNAMLYYAARNKPPEEAARRCAVIALNDVTLQRLLELNRAAIAYPNQAKGYAAEAVAIRAAYELAFGAI